MRVLVGCEYSARVRDAFRNKGHDAWSVDLLPTDGDSAYHYRCDVRDVLYDGWDMLIAFPPCTDLSTIGARYWPEKQADGRQARAAALFIELYESPVDKVAVENPTGWMNTNWRKPDQIIEPYQFGDPWKKRTCLWLKGLPALEPTDVVEPQRHWVDGGTFTREVKGGRGDREGAYHPDWKERARRRGRTFLGVADAMAAQWG